jgi:hypothetical protein
VNDHFSPHASTFFGVSRGLEPDERAAIRLYLEAAWRAQYGRQPSSLSADLESLEELFRSHVQAKRLRDAAESLGIIAARRPLLPEGIFVAVDDQRGFVTPEGRVLLDHLMYDGQDDDQVITRDTLLNAYALVADFYGRSQRRWMRKELTGGDIRPATAGFALFLLINNSVGRNRALLLPFSQNDEALLAKRVLPIVSVFSTSVGGSPVQPKERERLRSNWIVTEARRQMNRFIARADDEVGSKLWIEGNRENDLVKELGQQLARRKSITFSGLREALQRTLLEYEAARPMLASWGLAHERAGHTERVFDGLLDAYSRATGL